MSDLQGESSNFVNQSTALVAGIDWNGTNSFTLALSAPGVRGGTGTQVVDRKQIWRSLTGNTSPIA